MNDQMQSRTLERVLQKHPVAPNDTPTPQPILDALGEAYEAGLLRGRHHHPRYTRIDLVGQRDHYAVLTRNPGTNWINVELITPDYDTETAVPADNAAEQWIGTGHLRDALETSEATYASIDTYYQPLRSLAYSPGGYRS